ncbi:MAG: Dynein heavy chain 6, axonemal [Paramarteilia canceri]
MRDSVSDLLHTSQKYYEFIESDEKIESLNNLNNEDKSLMILNDSKYNSFENSKKSGAESFKELVGIEKRWSLKDNENIEEIIEQILKYPDIGFVYLKNTKSPKDKNYHPLDLKCIDFMMLDPTSENYLTISSEGVLNYRKGVGDEFTPLNYWIENFRTYNKLREIPFVTNYLKYKVFNVWKKFIIKVKKAKCSTVLDENLFFLNKELQSGIVSIMQLKMALKTFILTNFDQPNLWTIDAFNKSFNSINSILSEKLKEFMKHVVDIVANVGSTFMINNEITPDNFYVSEKQMNGINRPSYRKKSSSRVIHSAKKMRTNFWQKFEEVLKKQKIRKNEKCFTEMARKRKYCQFLESFCKYIENIIYTSLTDLYASFLSTVHNELNSSKENPNQVVNDIFDLDGIIFNENGLNSLVLEENIDEISYKNEVITENISDKRTINKNFIKFQLIAKSVENTADISENFPIENKHTSIVLDPNVDEIEKYLKNYLDEFEQTLLKTPKLLDSEELSFISKPRIDCIIDKKLEKINIYSLVNVFDSDPIIKSLRSSIDTNIKCCVQRLDEYLNSIGFLEKYYSETLNFEIKTDWQTDDQYIEYLEEALQNLQIKIKKASDQRITINIWIFQIDLNTFVDCLVPRLEKNYCSLKQLVEPKFEEIVVNLDHCLRESSRKIHKPCQDLNGFIEKARFLKDFEKEVFLQIKESLFQFD